MYQIFLIVYLDNSEIRQQTLKHVSIYIYFKKTCHQCITDTKKMKCAKQKWSVKLKTVYQEPTRAISHCIICINICTNTCRLKH
jgi:hypothetical protein